LTRAAGKHDSLLVTHLPNVRYLTGFTGSSGCVLTTPTRRLFFTDFRYRAQAAREVKGFDVRIVPGSAIEGCCRHITARNLKTGVIGYEGARMSLAAYKLMRRLLKGFRFHDASGAVEKLRAVKKGREITHLRQAAAITDAAYRKLSRSKVIGRTEKEIGWTLECFMRQSGSGQMPFEIIVASGPRSAHPHGVASDRVIREGELLMIDMGASVGGYCADATRTFATGPLRPRLKEIYKTVFEAQQLAMDGVADGAGCAAVDALAREHINAAGYGEHFGHALGHGVGLEAHEAPVLSSRSREVLISGMTVTVEPGIYVERVGGVRIEDTVLVRRGKSTPLTTFPRELHILR